MMNFTFEPHPRIRLVRQTEVAECGLASLAMIANFHGMDVDLGTLRRRFQPSLRGSTLRTLIAIANNLEFTPRAVKASLDHLGSLNLPAILHWNLNHYVVVERVSRGKALVHDPKGRSAWMRLSEVSDHFTGVALELRPSSSFQRVKERRRLRLAELWGRISGLWGALAQTFVLSLVLQLLMLTAPYYLQIAVDTVLPSIDYDLMTVLAIGFGLIAILSAGVSLLRAYGLLHVGTNVSVGLTGNLTKHLLRLPISWFEKRHSGDILSRLQSVGPVQKILTEDAAVGVVDGMLAVFTLVIMLFYSPALTALAVGAFLLHCILQATTYSAQREAEEAKVVAAGSEQTTQIETLRGIRTIRMFNRESLRLSVWQARFVVATNADVRIARIAILRNTASLLIFSLDNILSIWLAITFVISGSGFSLGMVFAYLAYKAQFTKRAETLVEQLMRFRMLELHLDRLSDIALEEEEIGFTSESGHCPELQGRIELRSIQYRYSPSDPLVLNDISFVFEKGQHVAITGASGGGKSTLIKILTGLVSPSSGEILVDGIPLEKFGLRNFQRQIATVLQDDSLFAGSLAENISFFDEDVDMGAVIAAAEAAAIHDDITAMPMQYETLVGDMGSTLSGGQKQRLMLARALYRKPRILIMDEGTAHLDATNEAAVNAAIGEMGITRIIVAHRSETVDSASQVVVMSGGRFVSPR